MSVVGTFLVTPPSWLRLCLPKRCEGRVQLFLSPVEEVARQESWMNKLRHRVDGHSHVIDEELVRGEPEKLPVISRFYRSYS